MKNESESKSRCPSEKFMDEVAAAYGNRYDDRDWDNRDDRPYLYELADKFNTSTVRIRKILITKGLYSTEVTREVARLSTKGYRVDKISEIMNLKPAAVCAALPYGKGIYNIDPRTSVGERAYKKRCRKAAVVKLNKCIEEQYSTGSPDISICIEELWNCITLFQGYWFKTGDEDEGEINSFAYTIKDSGESEIKKEELIIGRKGNYKTIPRSVVETAFINALNEQNKSGYVKESKRLACNGASYFYSIFIRFGIIKTVS